MCIRKLIYAALCYVCVFLHLQEVISNHKDPLASSYGRIDSGLRSSYSQLSNSTYSSSLPSQSYGGGYGSSGLGGYPTFRLWTGNQPQISGGAWTVSFHLIVITKEKKNWSSLVCKVPQRGSGFFQLLFVRYVFVCKLWLILKKVGSRRI